MLSWGNNWALCSIKFKLWKNRYMEKFDKVIWWDKVDKVLLFLNCSLLSVESNVLFCCTVFCFLTTGRYLSQNLGVSIFFLTFHKGIIISLVFFTFQLRVQKDQCGKYYVECIAESGRTCEERNIEVETLQGSISCLKKQLVDVQNKYAALQTSHANLQHRLDALQAQFTFSWCSPGGTEMVLFTVWLCLFGKFFSWCHLSVTKCPILFVEGNLLWDYSLQGWCRFHSWFLSKVIMPVFLQ